MEPQQEEIRILVDDDSDLMRRSLRTLLEGRITGKCTDEASNGQEAFTKFSNGKFDVVVLDFQMPMMTVWKLPDRSRGELRPRQS